MRDHARLRKMVSTVATRLPLGVGRHVREYVQTRADLAWVRTELDRARQHASANRYLRQRAELADRLLTGERLEDAVAATVRLHLEGANAAPALSLAQALQTAPATRVSGLVGAALVANAMGLPELAWASFREVPTPVWRRLAPQEFFRTAFMVDRTAALQELRHILEDAPDDISPRGWLGLVRAAFGAREERLAAEAFQLAESSARRDPGAWAETNMERDWLRPWITNVLRPPAPPKAPPDHTCLAIFDYKQPDWSTTSRNIGDWVQTLASLGHLVRHRNVRFHGSTDVLSVLDTLRDRLRPELRLNTNTRDVSVVPVHRDASSYCPIPPNTWAITFGWFMHGMFGRHDFPLHPHLRPIFISFHCNRQAILSPEAIQYLCAHGPVGCRDWTTVGLLLSAGVPAFFSGCLTTTLDAIFPDLDSQRHPRADAPVAYVDVKAADGGEFITHTDQRVVHDTLGANLHRALELMEAYRSRYSVIVTSRLHCYLPCRSIGAAVRFAPRNPADIRYSGIVDTTDAEFAAIQQGIYTKLAAVLEAMLAGRPEAEVYEIWRDVCADDVAKARARRLTVARIPPPSFDVKAACELVRAREVTTKRTVSSTTGPAVDVALALDGNLKETMNVVVNAMVERCSRPLHLWVLCRDHTSDDFSRFAALFPEVSVTWLPCDEIDYGPSSTTGHAS
jgi:hypothetical protein